jgi:hypothetical protein
MNRELALLMRVTAGSVIAYLGIAKLLIGGKARRTLWIPWGLSNEVFDRAVIITAAAEVIGAVLAIFLPVQIRSAIDIFVALLFCVLTLYGSVAVMKTGGCGCGGFAMQEAAKNLTLRAKKLIVRNVFVFGTLGCGMWFGVPIGDPIRGANDSLAASILFIMMSLPLLFLFLITGMQIFKAMGHTGRDSLLH